MINRAADVPDVQSEMNERGQRHPRNLRHGRRLADGTVIISEHDDEGRVLRETRYDPEMTQVIEVVEYDEHGELTSRPETGQDAGEAPP